MNEERFVKYVSYYCSDMYNITRDIYGISVMSLTRSFHNFNVVNCRLSCTLNFYKHLKTRKKERKKLAIG